MALGAILAVAILVLGIGVYVGEHGTPSGPVAKPTGDFGPKVLVSGTGNAGALSNNTTINIQIFSAVPAAFESPGTTFQAPGLHIYNLSAQSPWNNGVNEELLNATILPQNNTTAFFLAPTFDTIDQQWIALLSHDQGRNYPSLTIEAVKTVEANGSLYLYQYYDNLLYDPSSLQVVSLNGTLLAGGAATWFNGTGVDPYSYSVVTVATMAFNLTLDFPSTPMQVAALPTAGARVTASGTIPPGAHPTLCLTADDFCTTTYKYVYYNSTVSTLLKTSYANGTLPLLGVHIGRNADSGGSEISLWASVTVLNDTIDLNSAQPYVNAHNETTTTMSTTPSFTHTANVSVGLSGNSYDAIPTGISEKLGNNESVSQNRTTAFVGINGVEYEFQHYNQSTYEHEQEWKDTLCCTGTTCHSSRTLLWDKVIKTTYDGQYTSGGIIHVNSTAGLEVQAGFQSIWTAWVIQHTLAAASNGSLTLTTSGNDSSYQAATIWAATTGYLNASNAYQQAAGALAMFSTAIGLGLAIVDASAAANGVDLDATETVVITASLGLIADTLGMTALILSDFSSISAITGTQAVVMGYGFSNVPEVGSGSAYTMSFFESQSLVRFTVNGNTYLFFAPEDYLNATTIA
jgi:hypothetical protein